MSLARTQLGVTLIEMMIGLVIAGILLALGVPSFRNWLQNLQIRAATESVQNGLQLARTEAVRRNTPVRFQFTTSMTSACALSTAGPDWVISQDNPAGACDVAPSDTTAPRIIQTRTSAEGSANAVIAAGQSAITFNGLGRVTPVPGGDITINVTNPTGGTCAGAGPMHCLRVVVTAGGQIRMCDPARADVAGC